MCMRVYLSVFFSTFLSCCSLKMYLCLWLVTLGLKINTFVQCVFFPRNHQIVRWWPMRDNAIKKISRYIQIKIDNISFDSLSMCVCACAFGECAARNLLRNTNVTNNLFQSYFFVPFYWTTICVLFFFSFDPLLIIIFGWFRAQCSLEKKIQY